MIFVDTGYFIARADPNDSLHDRSMRWDVEISDRLLVTEYVICEVVNYFSALSERRRGHLIVDLVRISSAYQIINAATEWFDRGLRLHRARLDKEWSLTDCISFEVMRAFKVTKALSHDHHFTQAGFDALLRRDPP